MGIHNSVNVGLEFKWIFEIPGNHFSKHIKDLVIVINMTL